MGDLDKGFRWQSAYLTHIRPRFQAAHKQGMLVYTCNPGSYVRAEESGYWSYFQLHRGLKPAWSTPDVGQNVSWDAPYALQGWGGEPTLCLISSPEEAPLPC